MAQGCHLIYSNADREHFPLQEAMARPAVEVVAQQFRATFHLHWTGIASQNILTATGSTVTIDREEAARRQVDGSTIATFEHRFGKLSADHKAMVTGLLCARGDRQVDLLKGLGNAALNDEMAGALPAAIHSIFKHDPGTCGLFNPARNGASAWVSNLKNTAPGKADGIAYEVLATAKLLHHACDDLKILSSDRIDFGPKGQASYGSGNLTATDGWVKETFFQPYRKTIEADLLIRRPDNLGINREIAVDFKHYTSGPAQVSRAQLEGIKVALATGEVDEWHFVTNASSFGGEVVEAVKTINEELEPSGNGPIRLHTDYGWR